MSTAKINVTVRVTLGAATNFARAGTGAMATTASSTSDGLQAAWAAAAKYFAVDRREIELSLTQKGDVCARRPEYYLAWTKAPAITPAAKPLKLTTIKSRRAA